LQKEQTMTRYLPSRIAAVAAAVSLEALMFAGPGVAQTVRMFDEAPSIEQLRSILIPESRGGVGRRIEIPRRDLPDAPKLAQPAALSGEATGAGPSAPATATAPSVQTEAPAARPAAPSEPPKAIAKSTPRDNVAAPKAAPPSAALASTAPVTTAPVTTAPAPVVAAAVSAPEMPASQNAPDAVGFRINFALDSAVIPAAYHVYMDRVGELMRQSPELSLHIEGHTDASGSDEYNLTLSQRRAMAVAEYLVSRQGIEPERLSVAGKGKSEPLMEDQYDPRNRRVQFVRAE
jgi:outer membrane protein OmpA-like peptidoglycan-associated protein